MRSDVLAPRDEVLWFAMEMERQLRENDHKSGWRGLTPKQILHRIRQETGELERAFAKGEAPERVIAEMADIANFLMMAADNMTEMERDENGWRRSDPR